MDYTEIIVEVPSEKIDIASDIANMTVPYGIYIEDYRTLEEETLEIAHIDLIDEELINKDRSKGYIHIYIEQNKNPIEAISFLKQRFDAENINHNITSNICNNTDWVNNWKKFFKPFSVGEKLFIRPKWEENCDPEDRKVLKIEPGMAFGTGTHNTTKLCLETLEKYISSNSTVLDIGCGSGILSIASLLLGAKSSVGVDIDKYAVKTAIENGEDNGFKEPQYKVICGDLTDKVDGKYDIVVANIVADVIVKFCEDVDKFMNKDSVFITSGIINTREQDVIDAFDKFGFEIVERHQDDIWICFVTKLKQ